MGLIVDGIRAATAAEWDTAAAACPWATFFHTRAWADALAAGTSGVFAPQPMRVHFSDGHAAIVPLSRQRLLRGAAAQYVSSPAGTYGGWLAGDDLSDEHARLLAGVMFSQSRNLWWRLNPYDASAGVVDVSSAVADSTLVIDLDGGYEAVAARFDSSARRMLRRAERDEVVVREARGPADWETYYAIYLDSVRRWGRRAGSPQPPRLFEALAAHPGEGVRLWLGVVRGEPVSGMVVLTQGRHAVYWHGATLERALPSRASALLLVESARRAADEGRRWFDLNPSDGLEGVLRFKQHFGPAELLCPVVGRQSLLIAAGEGVARGFRRIAAGASRADPLSSGGGEG